MSAPRTVLFVCQHAAATSVIAAAYFNRLARERGVPARARSAGTEPDPAVPAGVRDGLAAAGLEPGVVAPRRLKPAETARAWRVVTFGCDLDAVAPPAAVIRWDDVPAVSAGFERARDAIVARVGTLLATIAADARA
jgi:arsenate reductase (thioredoxin)